MTTPQQKRSRRNKRLYLKKRERFLADNPWCARCGGRSDQVHHKAGRLGPLLLDETRWMPACAPCHAWIGDNPTLAYEQGWSLHRIGAEGPWEHRDYDDEDRHKEYDASFPEPDYYGDGAA